MKVVVLYRPVSAHARTIEDFNRDFNRFHADRKIDLLSLDTRDGASTASLYDIVQYPAILALSDDGQLLKSWQGENLPMLDEVASYAGPVSATLLQSSFI